MLDSRNSCLHHTRVKVRSGYPTDIDDETYQFMLPYLLLTKEDAAQRKYPIRDVLNALFWMARSGAPWEYLPNDLPPAEFVRQQASRWFGHHCFEDMVHDLRIMTRVQQQKNAHPTAVIIDSRTLQSTPESGSRAGFDGAKKKKGTKIHLVVDTLGDLLAVLATPANEQDRAQVGQLCQDVQQVTGQLLQAGADPNVQTRQRETPLEFLVRLEWPREAVVDARQQTARTVARMVAHGADLSVKNQRGQTPLDFCSTQVLRTEIERALREKPSS